MDLLWVIFSLIGVLGLFFVLIYALKKLNHGINVVNGAKMRVIDRVSVGRDGVLLVVSVAGKLMLIGATGQHIEKLSEIDMTPEEYSAQAFSGASGMSFKEALGNVIGKNKSGDSEKDSKDD